MRPLIACMLLLAGCLYFDVDRRNHKPAPPPDAAEIIDAPSLDCGPIPVDAGSCSCSNGHWWCNTCPWPSPEAHIACSQVGASCQYEDWEHGCDCTCDSSGWWACTPETIGSFCPSPPPPDAAL